MFKKIAILLALIAATIQSCYIEDNTPCIPTVDYSTQNYYPNYPYPPTVRVYFNTYCDSYGTRYYLLVQDNIYGTELIGGRYWRFVSGAYSYSPIYAYADYNNLAPNRTYRALIISDYGTFSEEFYIYTY